MSIETNIKEVKVKKGSSETLTDDKTPVVIIKTQAGHISQTIADILHNTDTVEECDIILTELHK